MLRYALLVLAICVLDVLSVTAGDPPQSPLHEAPHATRRPKHIAIIGAGPGGAAASYYLRRFSRSPTGAEEVPVEITVFESNSYIGGRTTTVNALDDPRYPVELGASIFVEINHILYNATRDFGLQSSGITLESVPKSNYELGIWDGKHFVYKAARDDDGNKSSWQGWWDIAKLFWRYGLAPIRTRQATKTAVGEFMKFYDGPVFPFRSIQEAVDATGLAEYTGVSGKEVLQKAKVGERFAREIIQASTRVNYASNLGGIHGLETLVCMAIEGAMAVEGGNWQIFDNMVFTSADDVFLNATVTDVTRSHTGRYLLKTSNEEVNKKIGLGFAGAEFDAVILAAPYQFSNLTFSPPLRRPPAKVPYVDLYVTLLTSPDRLSRALFDVESPIEVPLAVLTTLTPEDSENLGGQRGVDAVGPPGFWSISTLGVLNPSTDGTFCGPAENCTTFSTEESQRPQYLYKIFSPAPLTAEFVASLLEFPYRPPPQHVGAHSPLSSLPKSHVSWFVEKHWHSYPYETPRTEFENFTLCMSDSCDSFGTSDGLYYLNGMESFISTMETSALSGMNVAKLIVDALKGDSE